MLNVVWGRPVHCHCSSHLLQNAMGSEYGVLSARLGKSTLVYNTTEFVLRYYSDVFTPFT